MPAAVMDFLVHKDHNCDLRLLAWYTTAGGDLDRVNSTSGHGLMHAASVDEHPETIRWLAAQGAALNLDTAAGGGIATVQNTAMHLAAMHAKFRSLDALYAAGALIESRNSLGKTPLLAAVGPVWPGVPDKQLSVLEWFAAHGANLHATTLRRQGIYDLIHELKAQDRHTVATDIDLKLEWCLIHGIGSHGSAQEPSRSFRYGSFVELHGLCSTAGQALNGTQGTVKKYLFSARRYLVECKVDPDGHSISGESKRVKPENLRLVAEPAADSPIDKTAKPSETPLSLAKTARTVPVCCVEQVEYGDPVMIHSLTTRSDLNGTWARVATQPPETIAKGRVKVVRCEGTSQLAGPLWSWANLLETCSLATISIAVQPKNLAKVEAFPTSEPVNEGNNPASLVGLSTELMIKVFSFMSRAQRVTVAASHPNFRAILFDTGSAQLWRGVLKLELSSCTEQGSGWHFGETCTICGTSFLESRIYLCSDCQQAGFCERCAGFPLHGKEQVFCQSLWSNKDKCPTADAWVAVCTAVADDKRGSRKSVPLPHTNPKAGRGSLRCLTDRWLCALPRHFHRAISQVVTRLVISGGWNEQSQPQGKNFGSPQVGMGALLQPCTRGPAWPGLAALTTTEPDLSTICLQNWGSEIGRNTLIQHTWCEQLVRLAISMPVLKSLALSVVGDGEPGLVWSKTYGSFNDRAVLAAFNSVTHFEGFRLDPIYGWDHQTTAQRETAHLAMDHYWKIEELQKHIPVIARTLSSLRKVRLTCSGVCLWHAAEVIAQHCPSVSHLFLHGDSALTQIMGSQALRDETGSRVGWRQHVDWADDFRVHLDALQEHPCLKELHISWDSCSLKGYRDLEWDAFPGTIHCLAPEVSEPVSDPEIESVQADSLPKQKEVHKKKPAKKRTCERNLSPDLLFDDDSEFSAETLGQLGSYALLEARIMLLSHLVYDAQRAAGQIQINLYPVSATLPTYLHEEYRRITQELCTKTANPEVKRAIKSVFNGLPVAICSADTETQTAFHDRSRLDAYQLVNSLDEPYQSAWREECLGKHCDLSPQPFVLLPPLESLRRLIRNALPTYTHTMSCRRTFGAIRSKYHWEVFTPPGIIRQFHEAREGLAQTPGGLDILMHHVRWGLKYVSAQSRSHTTAQKQMFDALLVAEAEELPLPLTESAVLESPAKPVVTREVLGELIDALAACKNFGAMTVEHLGMCQP